METVMFISVLAGDLVPAVLYLPSATSWLSAAAADGISTAGSAAGSVAGSAAGWVVSAAPPMAVKTLPQVVDGLRNWIMGILAAVATLFLVIGGLLYVTANGDPASIEQAKGAFKAALTGYAMAVLAPVVLDVLQGILGA